MKTIAICGSQRENGNTEYFMRIALDELAQKGIETEFVSLRGKSILPCKGCYQCLSAGHCTIEDDFAEVFDKMMQADGILIGSPVYVARPTALMSALLERATFSGRAAVNRWRERSVDRLRWPGEPGRHLHRRNCCYGFLSMILSCPAPCIGMLALPAPGGLMMPKTTAKALRS